jgi:hypothetical protein
LLAQCFLKGSTVVFVFKYRLGNAGQLYLLVDVTQQRDDNDEEEDEEEGEGDDEDEEEDESYSE